MCYVAVQVKRGICDLSVGLLHAVILALEVHSFGPMVGGIRLLSAGSPYFHKCDGIEFDRGLALVDFFACLAHAPVFQIPPALEQRGVFYKQSKAGFYPTSCYVVADTLVNTILTVRTPVPSMVLLPSKAGSKHSQVEKFQEFPLVCRYSTSTRDISSWADAQSV